MGDAAWNGSVVGEPAHRTRLRGRQFLPVASVHRDLSRKTGNRPDPTGSGPETTFDVVVDQVLAHHGAWCHGCPRPDLLNIKDLVTFSPDNIVVPLRRPAPIRTPRSWRAALSKVLR